MQSARYRILAVLVGAALSTVVTAAERSDDATLQDLRNKRFPIERSTATKGESLRSIEGYKLSLDRYMSGMMQREARRRMGDQLLEILEGTLDEAPEEGQKTVQQQIADLGVEVSYQSAIKYYLDALKDGENLPGNEHVLYQLTRAYEGNAQPDKALATLEQLVTKFPESLYDEEARFRRAEHLFGLRQFVRAEQGYKELLDRYPRTRYGDMAVYKLAWTQLKQEKYIPTITSFMSLMDKLTKTQTMDDLLADMPGIKGTERELVKDIRRGMALSFDHLGAAEALTKFYAQKDNERTYDFQIFQDLADLYYADKRYQDAANVYKAFTVAKPTHRQAPFFHLMMMEAYASGGFADLYLQAKRDFAVTYAMTTPFWKDQMSDLKAQVAPYLRQHLGEIAQHHHAEAQKTRLAEDRNEAIKWYRLYLDSFPKDVESASMNFMLAELYYETKNYEQAAIEYERAAYSYGEHPNSSEAGYAALQAYEEHKKSLPEGEARRDWSRKQALSAIQFAKFNRKDPRAPAVLVKSAQEMFSLNEYDNAVRVAREAVALQGVPDQEILRSAWLVIAHSEFELKSYIRAEASYKQVLNYTRGEAMRTQAKDAQERLAASIYKQGEVERDRGNIRGAAQEFMRVAIEAPGASIREVADYDAATAFIVLKDWPAAIRSLESLRKTELGKRNDLEITQKLIVAYTEAGDRRNAAAQLERLTSFQLDHETMRDAQWRAAELYEKSNEFGAAITAYGRYVSQYSRPHGDAMEARQKLVELNGKQKNALQVAHWLQQLVTAENGAFAEDKTLRTRTLAAQAAFELAKPSYDSYAAVQLVEPIRENLKRKRDGLQVAVKAFNASAEYGIAEVATGSSYMVAEIYRDFASTLLKSPRPKDLDAEELEQYNLMLEEQAYPFEEKAIDLHQKNIQRVTQGVYDDWVKKSYASLAKISPGRYDKRERIVGYVDVLN